VSDTRRAPLTKALTGHSYDTMSQDSGMQCTCGSDSRFTQHDGSDLPWTTFEEHLANVALAALDALEHPALVRLRAQEAEAVAQGYTEGDVNHNLQPLVGRLRLRERDRQDLPYDDLAYYIDRMHKACNAERALLAQHRQLWSLTARLAAGLVDEDCELVGFSGSGRCIEPAVALRWEDGFLDQVCEEHAQRAQTRRALVIRPIEKEEVRGG
jgi:hypothetical protein